MVLRHLNGKKLLISDSHNPNLADEITMLDFEIVSWRPRLGRVAKGPDHAEGIITEELSFFTIAEPAELT